MRRIRVSFGAFYVKHTIRFITKQHIPIVISYDYDLFRSSSRSC